MSSSALPAVLVVLALAAGCGSDTTGIELAAVGRGPEPVTAPATDGDEIDGLPSCGEVVMLTPEDDATPAGAITLDQGVLAVLADYGGENREVYGGLWLDARYGGAPAVAFVDEVASHRAAILDRLADAGVGPLPGGMPFALVVSRYSLDQLQSVADELTVELAAGVLRSATVEPRWNRVALELLDPSEADIDRVLETVPAGSACTEIATTPDRPDGPLEVLPRDGSPGLLSCGDEPFPASALIERVPVGQVDHPAAALVVEFTGGADGGGGDDWIVLDLATEHALFGRYDGDLDAVASATGSGSRWEIAGWAFGCELQVGLPRGLGAVEVFLDPGAPARSDRASVSVLVSELGCAGGEAMGNRLLGPQVIETDDRVLLAFAALASPGDHQDCPGNPRTAVIVELDRPLAGRALLDGMQLPPRQLSAP